MGKCQTQSWTHGFALHDALSPYIYDPPSSSFDARGSHMKGEG